MSYDVLESIQQSLCYQGTLATTAVTAAATPVLVSAGVTDRKALYFSHVGSLVYCGGFSTIGTADAFEVPANEAFKLPVSSSIPVYVFSLSDTVVRLLEVK